MTSNRTISIPLGRGVCAAHRHRWCLGGFQPLKMRWILGAVPAVIAVAIAPSIPAQAAPAQPSGPCSNTMNRPTTSQSEQACQACLQPLYPPPNQPPLTAHQAATIAWNCGAPGASNPADVPAGGQPPPAAQAPVPANGPPMQDPFQQAAPHNGCFVASMTTTSNLLKECPNYTCASILDDQMREECKSLPDSGQKELLNLIGQDNPTGLYPTPLTVGAGTPPTPPDTGPCAGSSMPTLCNALFGLVVWVGGKIGKDEPPPTDDGRVGCICIRG
jgi:hypothetical protein